MGEIMGRINDFDYPLDSFTKVAEKIGVFNDPEITHLHEMCLTTRFDDEIGYQQGILALLHACDLAYSSEPNDTELQGIALCLADVHFRTGHYEYCWQELLFAAEYSDYSRYLAQALWFVGKFFNTEEDLPTSPVAARILVN